MDQIYKTDLNELFSYQRKGEKLEEKEKVIEIEIERLRDFKEHPFHVKDDKEMSLLKESIKNYGILSPLIVRPVLDGVYEIVSGHRRKYAAQQLGYYKLPVIIRVMNDDEAIISMVDSNLQRERIRYSEKAFAYKMKNEAMKRKGGRKKSQFDHKLKGKKTIELIGEEYGDSPKQVQRFIKITELIPELLQQLDDEMIGFNPAEPLYLGKFEIKETKAPHGMALNPEPQTVELVYAGQEVEITSVSSAFYNERQRVQIDLSKVLEQDEKFGIGQNGEILSVQFGLYAAEDITAADGMAIPKDGLIEIASCDENGKAVFATDLPVGAKLYVKEYSTDEHYLISDEIYPVEFAYAGQETAVVNISVNDGQPMENKLVRGSVIGKKIDEDGFAICGAIFGLFKADETEFTEDTAILTAESNEIGVFGFENVPFGNWIIRELKAAPAFVLNETTYPVTISENEEIVEIEIENRFIVGSVQTTKVDAQQK